MTLPKPPSPLSSEEIETLVEKFSNHQVSEEQKKKQEKYREKIREGK